MANLSRPQIKAIAPKTLYPRKDTLVEAEQSIQAMLPIATPNELAAALAVYHNTVLHLMEQESSHGQCHCTP